ncbi:MAG: B12-binding domain-containing radical SAM protein [Thermodesulfovibrionales bacterium]|nr:B12-binding domain-containing radical SAM protein [Thermodesulfovibrionales bacterium]
MKILLIYPYFLDKRITSEDIEAIPIGLYYIGAYLKENNYDIEILNWFDINITIEKIERTLKEKKPNIIGFSIVNANRWGAIDIAYIAKKIKPDVKIVFGGVGGTFLWEHLLRNFPFVDYIVIGEGERTFFALVENLKNHDYYSLKKIKGLAFREGNKIVFNGYPDLIENIDELPMPAKYFDFQHISSSRGCPSNCSFCGSPQFWGPKVRFHSPEYFVGQLEKLYLRGIKFFYFSDDIFTLKKQRVIKICKMIIERGLNITFYAISKVNYVDEEIVYWMRLAGCIQISYGVESGSEIIRKNLNKDIKTEHIKRAFSVTMKYGILPRAYFIYGSPGETIDTIEETINLILDIKPLSIIFYLLMVFPGTALYEKNKIDAKIEDEIWLQRIEDIPYFEIDPSLSMESVLLFGEKLRNTFYRKLPDFVNSIELIEDRTLFKKHSDFLSRLGLTFSHGDYSNIKVIADKDKLSEDLFKKALRYHPNETAFLGMGIIKQKQKRFEESVKILTEGLSYFPQDQSLSICLGITYMNLKMYSKALDIFKGCSQTPEVLKYITICKDLLGSRQ